MAARGVGWGWISYDPDLNLIYYGTSNPGAWNPNQRPGDNKWSASIFARSPDTGLAKWVFQLTLHDEWDYDAVNENILADLNVGGRQRKALVHLDRNGFGYTIDRETGVPLVAEKFDPDGRMPPPGAQQKNGTERESKMPSDQIP
jgi:glucose dehydrogenase